MSEELIQVDVTNEELAAMEDVEDSRLNAVIKLPDRAVLNNQTVLRSVQDIFKGFDHTNGSQFKDLTALAEYTQRTMMDIKAVHKETIFQQSMHTAAAAARFWYLGETICNALEQGKYGTAAATKLTNMLNMSSSYVYQINAVAKRLTPVDCYILGARGLTTTHLRKLAQVKDDIMRDRIITAFIEEVPDTSDPQRMESARKRFVSAINATQIERTIDITSSDPVHGGTETEVSPEYHETKKLLSGWLNTFKKYALPETMDTACSVMDAFYLSKSVPDAEEHMDEIKELAEETRNALVAVSKNITQMLQEIDSLQAAELVDASN